MIIMVMMAMVILLTVTDCCLATLPDPQGANITRSDCSISDFLEHFKESSHTCLAKGWAPSELKPVSARLSSTLIHDSKPDKCCGAENCIDASDFKWCQTASRRPAPWLAIDYNTPVTVEKVVIKLPWFGFHSHRTRNVDVRIANELPTSDTDMFTGGYLLGHFAGPGIRSQNIIISGHATVE